MKFILLFQNWNIYYIKYRCCLEFHELSLELLVVAVSLKSRAKKHQISPQFINLLSLQRNRNSGLKSEKNVQLAYQFLAKIGASFEFFWPLLCKMQNHSPVVYTKSSGEQCLFKRTTTYLRNGISSSRHHSDKHR